MKLNLPNKLTMLRVILVPVFVVFLLKGWKWYALAVFAIASLTDLLDGQIARKRHLVTDFGKFMDPLADKLLVCMALIALVELDRIPSWAVMILIAREFVISGFRLIAANKNLVLAAGTLGKAKTVCQMAMVILLIADFGSGPVQFVEGILIWLSIVLSLASLYEYLSSNWQVMGDDM